MWSTTEDSIVAAMATYNLRSRLGRPTHACVCIIQLLLSNSADRPPKHLAARNRHDLTRLTHAVYTRTSPDSEHPTVASWGSRATQLSPQDRRTAPPFRLSSAALTAATESTLPQMPACAYVRGRGNVSYPTDRDARMSPTGARKGVPSQQRDCRLRSYFSQVLLYMSPHCE